ncbi:MAG: preprotein translocase subunit SecG [Pseudomonadota bacterium]|nr:preprotein translocase subunit SecG [Pseudomonadota bacterium]
MTTVLLVIHLMIAAALVGVVLLQRSEGGALGIGGGGGGGGFMTGRGAANLLTRVTAMLAVAFFATSILLTIVARQSTAPRSLIDSLGGQTPAQGGLLLPPASPPAAPAQPAAPQAPQSQ